MDMILDSDEAIATQLEIAFDGIRYLYREFRYERLSDAVNYARICRAKPEFQPNDEFVPRWAPPYAPSTEDLQRMKPFGIQFSRGSFLYRQYRYENLETAINYAVRRVTG